MNMQEIMPVLQPHIYSHPGYIDRITMDEISLSVHGGRSPEMISIMPIVILAFTIVILLFNSCLGTQISENNLQLL